MPSASMRMLGSHYRMYMQAAKALTSRYEDDVMQSEVLYCTRGVEGQNGENIYVEMATSRRGYFDNCSRDRSLHPPLITEAAFDLS